MSTQDLDPFTVSPFLTPVIRNHSSHPASHNQSPIPDQGMRVLIAKLSMGRTSWWAPFEVPIYTPRKTFTFIVVETSSGHLGVSRR